jgi:hypothetical protein
VTVSGCNARHARDFQRFAANTSKAFASEGYAERKGQHRALSLLFLCSSIRSLLNAEASGEVEEPDEASE